MFNPQSLPLFILCKKYGYSGFGYKELSLRRNTYSGPNAYKSIQIPFAKWEPTLGKVCTSPLDSPIIDRVDVVTGQLLFV